MVSYHQMKACSWNNPLALNALGKRIGFGNC
jgi:hypothetical protein